MFSCPLTLDNSAKKTFFDHGRRSSGPIVSGPGTSQSKDLGANLRSIDWSRESLIKFEKNFYQDWRAAFA